MEGPVQFANKCVKLLLVIGLALGICGEVYEITLNSFEFSDQFENFQHVIMYSWYLIYYGQDLLYPKSDSISYPLLIVASATEAYLFTYHVHGRSTLERVTHWCLALTIWAGSVATTVEYFSSKDLLLPVLMRGIAFAWQGNWFWNIAFAFYPIPIFGDLFVFKDWEDESNILITKTTFVFHGFYVLAQVLLYAHWAKKSIVDQLGSECLGIDNQNVLYERLTTGSDIVTDDHSDSEDLEDRA